MNKDLRVVQNELDKYGIGSIVSLAIHKIENDRGKVVPHMVAKWSETTLTNGKYGYNEVITDKAEEMDRYFCAELFVNGIIQRAEWIKADHRDCVAYLEENQFGHPALYPQWKKNQKVSV